MEKSAELCNEYLLFYILHEIKPNSVVNLNDQGFKKMRIKRARKEGRVSFTLHSELAIIYIESG